MNQPFRCGAAFLLVCLLSIALRVLVLMQFIVRRNLQQAGATLKGIYPGQPGRQRPGCAAPPPARGRVAGPGGQRAGSLPGPVPGRADRQPRHGRRRPDLEAGR